MNQLEEFMSKQAVALWDGKLSENPVAFTFNHNAEEHQIVVRVETYEKGYEDFSVAKNLYLDGECLYGENSWNLSNYVNRQVVFGEFNYLKDAINYLKTTFGDIELVYTEFDPSTVLHEKKEETLHQRLYGHDPEVDNRYDPDESDPYDWDETEDPYYHYLIDDSDYLDEIEEMELQEKFEDVFNELDEIKKNNSEPDPSKTSGRW